MSILEKLWWMAAGVVNSAVAIHEVRVHEDLLAGLFIFGAMSSVAFLAKGDAS